MSPWIKLRKIMLQYFAESRWYTILGATAFYAASSYWLLFAAGEVDLIANVDFIYWLAVTASTVGYGDLSPVTSAGKLVVALYVIPLGLSIFAMVVGRIASWVSQQWKKGLLGMNSLQLDEHILVIGWNGQRTMLLLDLLLRERDAMPERPTIALCVKADIANPMPGVIEFVKVDSFNKDEDMDRACIAKARTILIDNPQDDVTMTTALYCAKRNPDAHQVAYFDDESLVGLLQDHCPKIECTPSVAVEMLAKAAFDPGSSMLHHDLLSVEEGQAQFSVKIPDTSPAISVAKLFINLKRKHNAIFIGYAPDGQVKEMVVNPPLETTLNAGDTLFYIAERRINAINWSSLDVD